MTITLIFLGVVMATIVGWLLKQSINTQPWVSTADAAAAPEEDQIGASPRKFALVAFLAVVTSFFALFVSAYALRMDLGDWRPLAEPKLLMFNTALLIVSSIFMQWGKLGAERGNLTALRVGVLGGVVTAAAFMVGQYLAWQQLIAAGAYVQSNPANAFFYLFTALHGLHLLGGLWVMKRAVWGVLSKQFDHSATRQTVDLCTIYWHFLLVVWLGLYWLMLST